MKGVRGQLCRVKLTLREYFRRYFIDGTFFVGPFFSKSFVKLKQTFDGYSLRTDDDSTRHALPKFVKTKTYKFMISPALLSKKESKLGLGLKNLGK